MRARGGSGRTGRGGASGVRDRACPRRANANACAPPTRMLHAPTPSRARRLYTVVPYLVRFVDSLTNVYVRYNRKRLKGSRGQQVRGPCGGSVGRGTLAPARQPCRDGCLAHHSIATVPVPPPLPPRPAPPPATAPALPCVLSIRAFLPPRPAEAMYLNLRRALPEGAPESIHFCDMPPVRRESASSSLCGRGRCTPSLGGGRVHSSPAALRLPSPPLSS